MEYGRAVGDKREECVAFGGKGNGWPNEKRDVMNGAAGELQETCRPMGMKGERGDDRRRNVRGRKNA